MNNFELGLLLSSMDFNPFKHKITELNKLKAEVGNVLIAEPFMQDPYFKRSVVLLSEHNAEGTVGFILNSPLDIQLSQVLPDFPEIDAAVFLGGPVQPQNLFYVHNQADLPGAVPISEKLYWDGDFDLLQEYIRSGIIQPKNIRFFLGYSGWDSDQLTEEIESQSWLISKISPQEILSTETDELWKSSVQAMGKTPALFANFPEDPKLN